MSSALSPQLSPLFLSRKTTTVLLPPAMRNPDDRGAGPTLVLSIFEGRDLAAVDPEVGSSDPGVLSAFVPAHYTGI